MSTEPYKKVDLATINNGAAMDLFQAEFQKVMNNINDININSEKEREITLRFKIKPTKDRLSASVKVSVSSKLQSIATHEGTMFISGHGSGAYVTNPEQMELDLKQKAAGGPGKN